MSDEYKVWEETRGDRESPTVIVANSAREAAIAYALADDEGRADDLYAPPHGLVVQVAWAGEPPQDYAVTIRMVPVVDAELR